MRPHGHGNAHSAKNERDERHEGEQASGLIEASGERRIRFAIVDDLGFGEELDESGFEISDRSVRDGRAV